MVCLASINVNGLQDSKKAAAIFLKLRKTHFDIIFLQETHFTKNWKSEIIPKPQWKGISYHSCFSSTSAGVSIFFKNSLKPEVHNVDIADDGRHIILDITINKKRILLLNIYAPCGAYMKERRSFFSKINDKIKQYPNCDFIILAGDFNCTIDNDLDRSRPTTHIDGSTRSLKDIISQNDLEDIWRTFHPRQKQFTHTSTIGTLTRLDRIYTSRAARVAFESAGIEPFPHSDHDCITLKLNFDEVKIGKGSWKLNTKVLTDDNYQKLIKDLLERWKTKKQDFTSLLH